MQMERIWLIVSILCLIVATAFLLRQYQEAAFVTGSLGVVAWFLSYRAKLKSVIAPTESQDDEVLEGDDDEPD
ncbi:MAG: hypothetical protein QOJ64_4227 [Acidobacteriota bacterium]|jgi:hypothetical protein|nr:hypothetical protein [Acidobacteriota bacterium]